MRHCWRGRGNSEIQRDLFLDYANNVQRYPSFQEYFRSAFLASPLGSRSEAEDLLQEVWLNVHRARHTYRHGEPALLWLYAIARHVRVDRYRKRRRLASHETAREVLPESAFRHGPSTQACSVPAWEVLLAQLPESQREVATLLKVNELSVEEVARITSSTVGAVKQKAHRAYGRWRQVLI